MYSNHSVNSSALILRGTVEPYSWRKEIIPIPSCNNLFFLITVAVYALITASDASGRKRKSTECLQKARSHPCFAAKPLADLQAELPALV